MASIYVNGKIYWAGGVIGYDAVNDRYTTTCKVEIRDVSTGSSSFTNLSAPRDFEVIIANRSTTTTKLSFKAGGETLF